MCGVGGGGVDNFLILIVRNVFLMKETTRIILPKILLQYMIIKNTKNNNSQKSNSNSHKQQRHAHKHTNKHKRKRKTNKNQRRKAQTTTKKNCFIAQRYNFTIVSLFIFLQTPDLGETCPNDRKAQPGG